MVFFKKQRTKVIICALLIICTSIIIYLQMNKQEIVVTELAKDEDVNSKVQVKTSLPSNYNVKLYKKSKEDKEFKESENAETKSFIFKENVTFNMETKDNATPNNVTNLQSSIVDDYIIISFEEAKDNGTEYEYYIKGEKEEDTIQSETTKIYSESGIKGYNYIIDNYPDTEAGFEVNKKDSEPILYSKIQWDKNYYLHIRAIDNSGNFSDNLTYKIVLPSKGLRMQYIDINKYSEISPEETIIGNVNDEYNIKEYNKELLGYKLVNIDGDEVGSLKKERINIKYMYAKDSSITVRHLNRLTGEEIASQDIINGYEGKNFKANHKTIKQYVYNSGEAQKKMIEGNQTIDIYYDEIGKVNVSYKDYQSKENIIPNEVISGTVTSKYNTKDKNIPGYELLKSEGETTGSISSGNTYVTYYYKKKAQIMVKHVDIDTNKVLYSEMLNGYKGDKVKVESREFEGYILNDNYSEYERKIKEQEEIKNNRIKNNKLEESKIKSSDEPKEENSIINEILEEQNLEDTEEDDIKIKDTIRQYDIVIDCGKTEYIIYYKKI